VSEQDIQLIRSDIRSAKKQIIAASMQLTDAQAEKFWPAISGEGEVFTSRF
jgi:hypothetical protein